MAGLTHVRMMSVAWELVLLLHNCLSMQRKGRKGEQQCYHVCHPERQYQEAQPMGCAYLGDGFAQDDVGWRKVLHDDESILGIKTVDSWHMLRAQSMLLPQGICLIPHSILNTTLPLNTWRQA